MKKILHLITGLERGGGAEAMLLKTLPYFKRTENIVCVMKGRGELAHVLEEKGIKVYSLGIRNPFYLLSGIRRYKKIIREIKPDTQINYLIHSDIFGRLLAKRFGVKKLISYIRNKHVKPIFVLLDRVTLKFCDYLLTNSESVLSFYRDNYKFPKERSSCIPNGVAVPDEPLHFGKEAFKKSLGVEANDRVISCVASFIKQKDHITLLRSMKILKDKGIDNVKLLLMGEGKERGSIESLWNELDLEDMVVFLGERDDVPKILSVSDLFVLPSIHEGMSNALLEAMAHGVPVLVSSIPENEELVSHNDNGLIFSVGDPESLVDNIDWALDNPDRIKEFSSRSRQIVEDKYDIKKIVDRLDVFFSSDFHQSGKVKVIYIVGSGHSGSTLLERIIGTSKNAFSVGELKFLKQFLGLHDPGRPYRRQERFVDASGHKLVDSQFWGDIVRAIKRNGHNVYDRYYKINKKIALSILFGLPFSTERYDDFEIFELILKKAREKKGEQVEYIIDSSKSLKRLISLKQDKRIDLHVLYNIRDVRGLVASREKNRLDWLKIFFSWLGINFLISVFLKRFLEKDRVMKLGYDSFASSPDRYIKEINKKFGLYIDEDTYIEDVNNEVSYVFAGHSMRARKFEGVFHDRKWKTRLPKWKQGILGLLGAIPNRIWVYKDK